MVDDVDIKQQNQNEHIDIETENVSGPQTVAFSKMEDIKWMKTIEKVSVDLDW